MPKHFFIPDLSKVTIYTRGYVPHWELPGATYSVTYRLHDSLPRSVVRELLEQMRILERGITLGTRKLTGLEMMDLRAKIARKMDDYLDQHHGAAYMNDPRIADIVASAITHFDGERHHLEAWCVMPNHVHAVVRPLGKWRLRKILHSWKSYSGNQANEALGRRGRFWQKEYVDRIIRSEEDLTRTVEYVLNNPAKAGLKNWKWTSADWKSAGRPTGSRRSASPLPPR